MSANWLRNVHLLLLHIDSFGAFLSLLLKGRISSILCDGDFSLLSMERIAFFRQLLLLENLSLADPQE